MLWTDELHCLSRISLNDTPSEDVPIPDEMVLLFEKLDTMSVTSSKIALRTKRDHTLSKVLEIPKRGIFPLKSTYEELKSYVLRQTELITQGDVLIWGNRVIIPPAGRQTLFNELHQTHLEIVKLTSLASTVI